MTEQRVLKREPGASLAGLQGRSEVMRCLLVGQLRPEPVAASPGAKCCGLQFWGEPNRDAT